MYLNVVLLFLYCVFMGGGLPVLCVRFCYGCSRDFKVVKAIVQYIIKAVFCFY